MNEKELAALIAEEKKKTGTVILAHTYEDPAIIDAADLSGDSYALAKAAKTFSQDRIVKCGVRFMGETVKILSPEKTVIMPKTEATCPMAEQIDPERVREYKKSHPDTCVVCYINTTAALKAECDVCVTSSRAQRIAEQIPQKNILFIPDKNLGSYIAEKMPEKNFELWDGYCPVHDSVTGEDAAACKAAHPGSVLAVHPECRAEVVAQADYTGATSGIIKYAMSTDKDVILGTERGVYDYLSLKNPDRHFYQLAPEKLVCENMKMTTLEDVYNAVAGKSGTELSLDENIRLRAKKCIDRMLSYGG